MTKKQILFWRFILAFIIVLGGGFIILNILKDKNIDQIIKIKKNIDNNKNEKKTIEKELSIRPDNFYKKKKDKN
ncbi:MAG: hypothetical protein B6227_02845 [Fusobacteriia bacterium 4572_74]|nr:MAG: hypothetical protein B6227_02845 [Fusobacteriia bacterium 4572_74]